MDREYIKDIVRMVISGWGYVALSHILTNFQGIPVVDFMEVFLEVAERNFQLDDNFIPILSGIRTVDELEWKIIYLTSLKTQRWS